MTAVLIGDADGGLHPGGAVLRRDESGAVGYVPITGVEISSEYDADHYPLSQRMTVVTAERSYEVSGRARSMLPLRNQRGGLTTRITEAFTDFECEGRAGTGMSEYLDQLVDGVPTGREW